MCGRFQFILWLTAGFVVMINSSLSRRISGSTPLNANLLNLLTLLSASGTTSSSSTTGGLNVFVNISGLGSLSTAQQQALANVLYTRLLSNGGDITTGSLFDAGLQPNGLGVGQFLGTSGLAASAAQAFANPFSMGNLNPTSFLFGLPAGALGNYANSGSLLGPSVNSYSPLNPVVSPYGSGESPGNTLYGEQLAASSLGGAGFGSQLANSPYTFIPASQRNSKLFE